MQNNTDRINYFICIRFLLRLIVICFQMEAIVSLFRYINWNLTCYLIPQIKPEIFNTRIFKFVWK